MQAEEIEVVVRCVLEQRKTNLVGFWHGERSSTHKLKCMTFVIAAISALDDPCVTRPSLHYPVRVLKWAKENLPSNLAELTWALKENDDEIWWDRIARDKSYVTELRFDPPLEDGILVRAFQGCFVDGGVFSEDCLQAADEALRTLKEIEAWKKDIDQRFVLQDVDAAEKVEYACSSPKIEMDINGFRVETRRLYYYVSLRPTKSLLYAIRKIGQWRVAGKVWRIPRSKVTGNLVRELVKIHEATSESVESAVSSAQIAQAISMDEKVPLQGCYGVMRVERDGDYYRVSFPYSKKKVDAIKVITGRRYVKAKRQWMVPIFARGELEAFIEMFSLYQRGVQKVR